AGDHCSTGPSGVAAQSSERQRAGISPSPAKSSSIVVVGAMLLDGGEPEAEGGTVIGCARDREITAQRTRDAATDRETETDAVAATATARIRLEHRFALFEWDAGPGVRDIDHDAVARHPVPRRARDRNRNRPLLGVPDSVLDEVAEHAPHTD